jgi:acyl-ACP thioesterase
MTAFNSKSLVLTNSFKVTSADTDMFARIRLGALVNLLIQSAINSADNLGFGFGGLKQQHLFWVLSRLSIEIKRPLKWYEPVLVETWPKDVEKILYIRDFIVRDAQNQIVANATSGWLAIDLISKRPKTIDGLDAEIFSILKEKHALNRLPEKVMPIKEGEKFDYKSSYFDIDMNKHATSTRYIDWMMDTFPIVFHENNYPKKLHINYNKETLPGESVSLIKQGNGKEFTFTGLNTQSNTNAYKGKIVF